MANALDLTKYCALCGALLPHLHGLDPADRRDRHTLLNLDVQDEGENIDLFAAFCVCEGRGKPGKCGHCTACRIERHGCACDGAYGTGCFNCTPKEHKRPPCPTTPTLRPTPS